METSSLSENLDCGDCVRNNVGLHWQCYARFWPGHEDELPLLVPRLAQTEETDYMPYNEYLVHLIEIPHVLGASAYAYSGGGQWYCGQLVLHRCAAIMVSPSG